MQRLRLQELTVAKLRSCGNFTDDHNFALKMKCAADMLPSESQYDQLIAKRLFPLPVPPEETGRDDLLLVYSPLTSAVQLSTRGDLDELNARMACHTETASDKEMLSSLLSPAEKNSFLKIPESPSEYSKLAILLNNKCNFSCEYCYSAKGRSKSELTCQDVDGILDYFIDPDRIGERYLKFFISGGGEPFLSGPILEYLLNQIDSRCKLHGFRYGVIIITNGSLLSEKWIRFLLHFPAVHVSVSFELDELSQNQSRGHFAEVSSAIRSAVANGIVPSITSTVMPDYVDRMPEMCERLLADYPGIKAWSCAPAILPDSSFQPRELEEFYRVFTENFFRIWKRMKAEGKSVGFSFFWNLEQLGDRFCDGKLCVTAERDIIVCPFSSSPKEKHFHKYLYGHLDRNGCPVFDQMKFTELMEENRERLKNCTGCFLRWHCAGICFNRHTQLQQYRDEICKFYKLFGARYVREKYYDSFFEQTGELFTDYVKGLK